MTLASSMSELGMISGIVFTAHFCCREGTLSASGCDFALFYTCAVRHQRSRAHGFNPSPNLRHTRSLVIGQNAAQTLPCWLANDGATCRDVSPEVIKRRHRCFLRMSQRCCFASRPLDLRCRSVPLDWQNSAISALLQKPDDANYFLHVTSGCLIGG